MYANNPYLRLRQPHRGHVLPMQVLASCGFHQTSAPNEALFNLPYQFASCFA
jgi:hypothetical protein